MRIRLLPLVLALPLAACDRGGDAARGGSEEVPESDRYGGTAVVASTGDIPDINPLTSIDNAAENIQRFVLFTPVIGFDEGLEPTPALAERWEVSADTTEITFFLRDDVYFHDGVKSTAHDLKFFYDRARDPETGYPNTNFFDYYGDAVVVDSFTLRVKMKPHADFMDFWRRAYALPRHLLAGVPSAEMRDHPYGKDRPVGNGPFRFVSHVHGQSWTFEANPDHPEELGGRPYLDRIVYRIVPEPTTALTELITGTVDYYMGVPPAQASRVKESGSARLHSYPGRTNIFISWNESRPLFRDARVRRALTLGIDRQGIIDGVLYGYGQIANSTVPPFHWAHDAEIGSDLGYDPERARRLLAEAGWQDRNGDGVVENEEGEPFRFEMKTNQGNQTRSDIVQIAQADLRKIGVDVQPKLVEWAALLEEINDPDRREFDAVVIGWVTEFRVDDRNLFHCSTRHLPFNRTGYCEPETDELLDRLQLVASREAARPLWKRYQEKIAHDQPYTFLYFPAQMVGVNRRLQGVHADVRGDWVGATRWWILPEARKAPATPTP